MQPQEGPAWTEAGSRRAASVPAEPGRDDLPCSAPRRQPDGHMGQLTHEVREALRDARGVPGETAARRMP
jgi:hypothetical protein